MLSIETQNSLLLWYKHPVPLAILILLVGVKQLNELSFDEFLLERSREEGRKIEARRLISDIRAKAL